MPIDTATPLTLPAALFGEPMQPPPQTSRVLRFRKRDGTPGHIIGALPFPDQERANRERTERVMRARRVEAARLDGLMREANRIKVAQAAGYEQGDRDARRMLRDDKWFWLVYGVIAGMVLAAVVANVFRLVGWL